MLSEFNEHYKAGTLDRLWQRPKGQPRWEDTNPDGSLPAMNALRDKVIAMLIRMRTEQGGDVDQTAKLIENDLSFLTLNSFTR